MIEKNLMEILACPICKGELIYDSNLHELICRFDRLAYPITNDIPVLIQARSRRLTSEET